MNGSDLVLAARRLEVARDLDAWTALMRVLVARLNALDLPPQLHPTLLRAKSHWYGHPVDLQHEKVEVWRYLEALEPSGVDLAMPEGRAARALLCVLEPEGDDEARSMTAEWFAAMVSGYPTEG